jgi:hypothetical protein
MSQEVNNLQLEAPPSEDIKLVRRAKATTAEVIRTNEYDPDNMPPSSRKNCYAALVHLSFGSNRSLERDCGESARL